MSKAVDKFFDSLKASSDEISKLSRALIPGNLSNDEIDRLEKIAAETTHALSEIIETYLVYGEGTRDIDILEKAAVYSSRQGTRIGYSYSILIAKKVEENEFINPE